jgi:hypothetical protein
MPIGTSVPSAGEICIGDRVRLTQDIWDDGEDHHPPGWLARAGELLTVKAVRGAALAVAHEGAEGAFIIRDGEYEPATQQ